MGWFLSFLGGLGAGPPVNGGQLFEAKMKTSWGNRRIDAAANPVATTLLWHQRLCADLDVCMIPDHRFDGCMLSDLRVDACMFVKRF